MLKEIWRYLNTPASDKAKRFGLLKEIVALEFRALRHNENWLSHQNNCKTFIQKHIPKDAHLKSSMILGAGLGQEYDLENLSRQFKHVYLVDLIKSRPLEQLIKTYPNVTFIECDLSGIDENLNEEGQLQHFISPKLTCPSDLGLLISSNLLSQLPLFALKKNQSFLSKDESSQKLIEINLKNFHLKWIKAFSSSSTILMISDVAHLYFDKNSRPIQREDHSSHIFANLKHEKWIWPMAPLGEISQDYSLHLEVWALILNS